MITARNLRSGNIILMDDVLHLVLDSQHFKPGKGGAFVKAKFRNLKTSSIFERTLRPEDTFESAHIDMKSMQFMYKDGNEYHFMDQETYEQFHLDREILGDVVSYIAEQMIVQGQMHDGKIIGVSLPASVELKIAHTEPGIKGDTAKSGGKPATLETGLVIRVPLFVNEGDVVKVDTRTGEYLGRA